MEILENVIMVCHRYGDCMLHSKNVLNKLEYFSIYCVWNGYDYVSYDLHNVVMFWMPVFLSYAYL